MIYCFFFQAEDGIRDYKVTGVQTCALPISDGLVVPPWRARQLLRKLAPLLVAADGSRVLFAPNFVPPRLFRLAGRSEERRVGKECSTRWAIHQTLQRHKSDDGACDCEIEER